jgi:hypothetical protein
MDICFLITTYNRQESCQRLVDSLQGLGDIVVVGDHADYEITGCEFHNLMRHNGRSRYWSTVNILFCYRGKHKYYIMLPDDFIMNEGQLREAINTWVNIQDPRKICLNLFMDRYGLACWTGFKPVDKDNLWQTGWVDMCFLAEEPFFNNIRLESCGIFASSSGVGALISKQLFRRKFTFYQVKESLVTEQPEHSNSQMHKKHNI